jgi:hypothetical protein
MTETVKSFDWLPFLACPPLFTKHGGFLNDIGLIKEYDQSIKKI